MGVRRLDDIPVSKWRRLGPRALLDELSAPAIAEGVAEYEADDVIDDYPEDLEPMSFEDALADAPPDAEDDALDDAAAREILERRMPSLERTAASAAHADELIARYERKR